MIFIKYLNYVCNNELLLALCLMVFNRVIQGASRDEMGRLSLTKLLMNY